MPFDRFLMMLSAAILAGGATVAAVWASGTPVAAVLPVTLAAALALRLARR
ncbi:hypothetical protein V8J36_12930 [Frigidibacter sp. MR17.14]|uniref:hypothetical protein n=1 Tax=Frigidibacter sp. MR17.14 TaxID=3126509 RepID=UPI003012B830